MTEIETITRKWGNSLGITLPRRMVEEENLHENQKVMVEIKKVMDITRIRGLVKFKRSAQEIKEEMRKGWQ